MMRYVLLVAMGASLAGQTPQYKAPEERLPRAVAPQPVAFSHKAHVAAGSKCADCHVSVERGARASIPHADRCMLCQQAIKKDSPQIRELARIWESGAKIAWVRMYQVPQFVFFNHGNHRKAGIECVTCHGAVADREVLWQEISTGMVGCMNCHAARKVSTECHFCHALGY
jgi:hypothetical protein